MILKSKIVLQFSKPYLRRTFSLICFILFTSLFFWLNYSMFCYPCQYYFRILHRFYIKNIDNRTHICYTKYVKRRGVVPDRRERGYPPCAKIKYKKLPGHPHIYTSCMYSYARSTKNINIYKCTSLKKFFKNLLTRTQFCAIL